MKPQTEHWLSLAEYDIETAEAMFQTGRYLYVTFMCQQSIEKALKGLITEFSEMFPPKSHDLLALIDKAGLTDNLPKGYREFLNAMGIFAMHARYPANKEELSKLADKSVAFGFLEKSREVLAWLKQKVR